jgi:hypothetical protein
MGTRGGALEAGGLTEGLAGWLADGGAAVKAAVDVG